MGFGVLVDAIAYFWCFPFVCIVRTLKLFIRWMIKGEWKVGIGSSQVFTVWTDGYWSNGAAEENKWDGLVIDDLCWAMDGLLGLNGEKSFGLVLFLK